MRWPRWLRRRHPNGDARAARERAEETLRQAKRQAGQVRREAARPLPADEFVERVARAFHPRSS